MTDSGKAVFLSYASQDASAAERVCDALRSAGVEVWFDKNELSGGDTWDAAIRRQIKSCALFVPMISANTQSREEGYFRREWNLAVARTLDMVEDRTFLLPIVIDATSNSEARVPEKFREVQWTRLPEGANADAFAEHVRRILYGGAAPVAARASAGSTTSFPVPPSSRSKAALFAAIAVVCLVCGYWVINRAALSKHGAATAPEPQSATVKAFNPPPHSIAVLPFANMSGDKEQEYFSDGLTEEILNSLAEIRELQVAARTSAFSFKATNTDIGTIARKLNVGSVLEGSVRRSAHTIRITVQLNNAVTGFQLWSKSYDRSLGDVLKLQTEIATAVAGALKVTLLGDIATKIELGGTGNAAAFDAYLRGAKAVRSFRDTRDIPAAIAAYTEAIHLDPHYALAFAARSIAFANIAAEDENAAAAREGFDKAQADARQALALAPDLAQAHLASAFVFDHTLDFMHANDEYERALALAPGSAEVLRLSGGFAVMMGHFETGIAATRRAVVLDPLASQSHALLGRALFTVRHYEEAAAAFAEASSLNAGHKSTYASRGLAFYGLGDLERARGTCEAHPDHWMSQQCLAIVYAKLGRHADAEAVLSKLKAMGDSAAYQVATVYAQWGNPTKALEWLEIAMRLRDPGLIDVKTDPLLDPLRSEPRFQAIQRALKFPD